MTTNPHANGTVHTFQPAGMDVWDRRPHQPQPGQQVRVVQPHGVPRNGTMGHVYVEDAGTGEFHGLVVKASLQPVSTEPSTARSAKGMALDAHHRRAVRQGRTN